MNIKNPRIMKMKPLAFMLSALFIHNTHSAGFYFPSELLSAGDAQLKADLSHFQLQGRQLPGQYSVDVYINQKSVGNKTLLFKTAESVAGLPAIRKPVRDDTGLQACLSAKELREYGINMSLYPEQMAQGENPCLSPGEFIEGAFTRFTFSKLRLDISVPQASMLSQANGYIDPALWDDGITAAILNYQFSGNNGFKSQYNSSNYFLNLNTGLNIGPWRLRDYRNWSYSRTDHNVTQQWQRIKTYAERAVIPFRSTLTLGESTTDSEIFDSLNFRGVQMSTDDAMYPDTQRGYAPVVRGIAESNAQVTVRQNGYSIYKTNVPPGAFEINDLYPMSSSGDLEVSIQEASGSVRVFTVPYSSVPMMLREGRVKYSMTAGRFHNKSDRYDDPSFLQSTLLWGLPHNITAYGGMQYAQRYLAGQFGTGINLGMMGAVSADITHASSTLADGNNRTGQSVRFLYSQSLNNLGTTFRLTGYRYSTRGFHTLDETALKSMSGNYANVDHYDDNGERTASHYNNYYNLYNSKRARMEANISQKLLGGSLYVSGVRQTYWNTADTSTSLQTGYSHRWGIVNYTLSHGLNKQQRQAGRSYTDRNTNLSLSFPLSELLSPGSRRHSTYATYNTSRNNGRGSTHQLGISGNALEQNNLGWSVSQGHTRNQGYSGNASVNYRGGYGNGNAGYSYNADYQRVSYGASGSALVHRDGLTLGQPLNGSAILVAAPGAAGIGLRHESGVKTDSRGYAIKPYATAYRENRVSLDNHTADDQIEIDSSVSRVVPTNGAIIRTEFAVKTGLRMLATLTHKGTPLPFGTVVTAGENSGIVGDGGQVFLTGMPESGTISAQWGAGSSNQCKGQYTAAEVDKSTLIPNVNLICG